MRFGLTLLVWSGVALAHEIHYTGQHLKLNRQRASGWLHELSGTFTTSRKFDLGFSGAYLERFDLYERSAGIMGRYRPSEDWTIDVKYNRGFETEVLPHDRYTVTAYHSLTSGLSPFLMAQTALYSVTHLNMLRLGLEIEKIKSLIIVPQIMAGEAKFIKEAETEDIHSLGLRLIHYQENIYSAQIYGVMAREAAQAVVGESAMTINTRTIGAGASYYFIPQLKTELLFDYTDYEKIQNQFLSTTLNLVWSYL